MLGHLLRHLELLRFGYISKINTGPVKIRLVKTRAQLDQCLDQLQFAKVVAWDTEGHNVQRINNTIITVQISFDQDSSWVIPIHHAENELSSDDIKHFKAVMKRYLERGKRAEHVYAAAAFDIHQFYSLFDLEYYAHDVYDVQSAEFCLDEQRMHRKVLGIDQYTLERISEEYGLHNYESSPIKKKDRDKMPSFSLQDVADYGGLDTALLLRIRAEQLALAANRDEYLDSKPYRSFHQTVVKVLGIQTQQFVAMERNGLLVDKKYAISLQKIDSVFAKETKSLTDELFAMPEVIEANRRLLARANRTEKTLFSTQKAWIFSLRKNAHLELLFFEVCKLKAVSHTEHGKPQLNKPFWKKYEYDSKVVATFQKLRKLNTLQNTFVTGLFKILTKNPDNFDGHLRTAFRALQVITGRSSSVDPNLQNIPTHGEGAKGIKRQFISKKPRLFVKRDFSAHEIRGWGAVSRDPKLANTFWVGMQVRLAYAALRTPPSKDSPEGKEWKTRLDAADVHRQNYQLIYKVKAELVNSVQRNSVKEPIFGKVYGKGDRSLGKNLADNAIGAVETAIRACQKAMSKHESEYDAATTKQERNLAKNAYRSNKGKIPDLQKELARLVATTPDEWLEKAKEVSDVIFNKTFKVGGKWLKTTHAKARMSLRVRSPIGRVRHLFGHLHIDRGVHAAMDRRGPNSNIQGFGSDMGFIGGYLMRKMVWEFFGKRQVHLDYVQCNTVHDSTETECHPIHIPLIEYLHHHAFTTLNHRFLRDEFNFELPVGFEMDAEIGASLAVTTPAPTMAHLVDAVRAGLEWGNKNLEWDVNVEKYMPVVEHNAAIIQSIRRKEIKRQLENETRTNYEMIMTKENCMDFGLIFTMQEWKEHLRSQEKQAA